jgi:predicted XRE-type DNA-binding protein
MASIVFENTFDAVTDDPVKAAELETRAQMMIILRDMIDEQGWTQAEAAKYLGLTQPRVSDLKKGKIGKFSIDKLFSCLIRLGYQFQPHYRNSKLSMKVTYQATS